MMFVARGLVVSLAFFATIYCPLSLLVVAVSRLLSSARSAPPHLLFGLRIFPYVLSLTVAVFFAFPSFWLLERPSLDEDIATFVLAVCSLVILGAGLFRMVKAQTRTSRAIERWMKMMRRAGESLSVSETSSSQGCPPLILVGICNPTVMVSDLATSVLSESELRVAVQHELGHMRSWDNLKKVLVSATPFPGMASLEGAWREAAELAADDAAVANRQEALDLASALIKLSRYSPLPPEHVLATGLIDGGSITLRVQRLLSWRKSPRPFAQARTYALLVVLALTVAAAANYGATLAFTHRLTELLVP